MIVYLGRNKHITARRFRVPQSETDTGWNLEGPVMEEKPNGGKRNERYFNEAVT